MGLPQQFQSIVQSQLDVHAAWVPISNAYKLGDYGLIADGVFQKLGNIQGDFGVSFEEETGSEASLSFVSDRATIVDASVGATVNLAPDSDLKANVTYKFEQEKSVLIKAPIINVSQISNVNQVANQLKSIDPWRQKYKVIFQVYVAQNPLIISTVEGGTEVTFGADTGVLEKLKIGSASAKFSIKSTKALGLEITGKTGVIALGLFKLNWLTNNPEFLSSAEERTDLEVENINKEALPDDL